MAIEGECDDQFSKRDQLVDGVTVSTKGRFHFFDLARELQKAGNLRQLITSLPAWYAPRFGIDKRKVRSVLSVEVLDRAWARFPKTLRRRANAQFLFSDLYDRLAARYVDNPGKIFVGLSSFALHTMRRAKAHGAAVIVERSSSHIEFQREILAEEYRRLGASLDLPHPRIVEKELLEYTEADFVVVPSDFVRQTFLEKGFPEQKLIRIPFGVDISRFSPQRKNDNVFRVIYCGGITVRKGIRYLLQAFSELALPNSELWLIGALNDESQILLGGGLPSNVRHLGPFPQMSLPNYYSQGSVFCIPSIEEGLAMVQAQAMACGLPVICTTNTGGADIVREGIDGFVVPIRSVNALKERILELYENPARRDQMAHSARERVERGFSWEDYGKVTRHAYLQVLNSLPRQH